MPFIVLSAFASWFGMNDIASAKASFAEQAVIFQRRHNWIMCWLYTGTFGSFIGFSAGFPLLARMLFPEVNALSLAFLGPLVGALSRSGTGWLAPCHITCLACINANSSSLLPTYPSIEFLVIVPKGLP